jgi:hypothetical protein
VNSFLILLCFIVARFVGEVLHTNYFNELSTEIEIVFLIAVSFAVMQDIYKLRYYMKMVEMANRELKPDEEENEEVHPPSNLRPA